ncbi:MAG: YidC/Oxa1 family membrane protein insertase [Chloroflexi bacterium]|nr:YidC/Oxa1 family membrane protein insertase [Chloroflexota bacterium]
MPIGFVWQTFLETPLINLMVGLSALAFGSYGLAILIFTVISRAVTFPLTLRTLHSMRALQDAQPRIQEIQKKYSDPKRRSEETMKLYRELGVNPLGCLGPQLIQLPVFIALYQVIRITLGTTPESVLSLSGRLYDWDIVQGAIPLSTSFLILDLRENGPLWLVAMVFVAMWLQQRISSGRTRATAAPNPQQAQMNQMMQWMMPAIFSWFVFIVPAGLGLYWAGSTVIGIVLQWIFVGPGDFTWGSLVPDRARASLGMKPAAPQRPRRPREPAGGEQTETEESRPEAGVETRTDHGHSRGQRKDGRRGRRPSARSARSQSRSGRRRRR